MYPYYLLLPCLFSLLECAPLPAPSSELLKSCGLSLDATGATAFALLYGSPLIQFLQLANGTLHYGGSNILFNHNVTATSSTRNVVRPNVDTIYAEAIFDLSATDLVLTLPAMEDDRFYLAAFYDPFGDNFASLGSVPASAPGKYLLQSKNSSCVGYEACITSPTLVGTLLFRVEVKNNTTDVADVDSYLDKSTLTPVNPCTPTLPALKISDFENLSNTAAIQILQLTARLESRALPETRLFRAAVPAILTLAGIQNGTYSPPSSLNLTRAASLANSSISAFTALPSSYTNLGNNWSIFNSTYIGTYLSGQAIVPRSITATELYLGNQATEALYPTLGATQLSLTKNEAYMFTFSGKPPVSSAGFWSVTMYDDSGYLVANSENTWAVGDRSNITFADGSLVYGNGAKDASFQVLIQDADVAPPGNWTANWLPAPSGGGDFTVTFRLYAPLAAASDGSYVYPVVTKVASILALRAQGIGYIREELMDMVY